VVRLIPKVVSLAGPQSKTLRKAPLFCHSRKWTNSTHPFRAKRSEQREHLPPTRPSWHQPTQSACQENFCDSRVSVIVWRMRQFDLVIILEEICGFVLMTIC
jgi:hypothetical protein